MSYDKEALDELAKALQGIGFITKDTQGSEHEVIEVQSEEGETLEGIAGIISHLNECPECYNAVWTKVFKEKDYECVDCGLPMSDPVSLENCPSCHAHNAKRRK